MDIVRDRFNNTRAALIASTLEREDAIDAMLRCAIAGRHMLLLGEPGTAKSRLVETFASLIDGVRCFTYLLTRYTEPAEIFGPVDVKEMQKSGALRRRTAGYMPEAEIAFLDEAFKGSSAILNAMLRILNEREIFNDGAMQHVPLRFAMLASNEVPDIDDHSVGAFYDRVLVRLRVGPVEEPSSFAAMMQRGMSSPSAPTLLLQDLDTAHNLARALPISTAAVQALSALRTSLRKSSVIVSDRRWVEVGDYLRAHAWMAGAAEVGAEHVAACAPCLWSRVDQMSIVDEAIATCAPSWEREARDVRAVIREQVAEIGRVAQLPKAQATTALGGAITALDDLDGDITKVNDASPSTGKALKDEADAAREKIIAAISETQRRRG